MIIKTYVRVRTDTDRRGSGKKPAARPVVKMEIDGRIQQGKTEAPTDKDEPREWRSRRLKEEASLVRLGALRCKYPGSAS